MPRPSPREAKTIVASWAPGHRVVNESRYFAGMFLDVGNDSDLDAAARQLEWPVGKLRHREGAIRDHYLIPTPTLLYVLINGVPYKSVGALVEHPAECVDNLIGARWRSDVGEKSALSVHVLFADLLQFGYTKPIPFVVRSNHTDDLLRALLAHNSVLDRAESALDLQLDFHALALPITAGDEAPRGQGELTSTVSPITAAHPAQLTRDYIYGKLAPPAVGQVLNENKEALALAARNFIIRAPKLGAAPPNRSAEALDRL